MQASKQATVCGSLINFNQLAAPGNHLQSEATKTYHTSRSHLHKAAPSPPNCCVATSASARRGPICNFGIPRSSRPFEEKFLRESRLLMAQRTSRGTCPLRPRPPRLSILKDGRLRIPDRGSREKGHPSRTDDCLQRNRCMRSTLSHHLYFHRDRS